MSNNNPELHTILGTGPLGMAVMRELVSRGCPVRMVNTRGQANVLRAFQAAANQNNAWLSLKSVHLYACEDECSNYRDIVCRQFLVSESFIQVYYG